MLWALTALPLTAQSIPTLTVTRDLRIDATTNDFTPINYLSVGRDGSIGVFQWKEGFIAFFDAKGTPLGKVGRTGHGPGEFVHVDSPGWMGDTLWAIDYSNHRTTIISPTHTFVRNIPWPTRLMLREGDTTTFSSRAMVRPYAMYPNGDMLLIVNPSSKGVQPAWFPQGETREALVVTTTEGIVKRFLAWQSIMPGPECRTRRTLSNGVQMDIIRPFCGHQPSVVAHDGSRVAFVLQSNAGGKTADYRVVVISIGGDTICSCRFSYAPPPITKQFADSFLNDWAPTNNEPKRAAILSVRLPPFFPPVHAILLGEDGTIWLEMQTTRSDHTWWVLSATGVPVGVVTLPKNVTLYVASRNQIWATEADADDLESVVRYRVTARP